MYSNDEMADTSSSSSKIYNSEYLFRQSASKHPSERTTQDLTTINTHLRSLEALSSLRESHIRHLCTTIRYEIHDAHHVLFSRGELTTCWYILLSGSVFIDSTMYLPRASFGKRTETTPYRTNGCVVLEPSEMLVIDYPDLDHSPPTNIESVTRIASMSKQRQHDVTMIIPTSEEQQPTHFDSNPPLTMHRKKSMQNRQRSITMTNMNEIPASMTRSSHSRASDTSSAYSGSDVMQSSTNGEDCLLSTNLENSLEPADDVGLSRCISVNESDDESEVSSEHSFAIHDRTRDVLIKDANERTDEDIQLILDFLTIFPAFANLTSHVRRELCKVLVYAQVEKAQTVVMNDGERYDSWSVIINGKIADETIDGKLIRTLNVGDSFGCGPTLDQYCHQGIMKTCVDDCQFVVIGQNDYYAVLNQGEKNIRKYEENGRLVMVKEQRIDDDIQQNIREIVIKGTTEKLLDRLLDEGYLVDDPNYVQDFLLTYRTFLSDPNIISTKLLERFKNPTSSKSCEHVAQVLLTWVNNHYNDFETNPNLYDFLELFDDLLQNHEDEQIRSWRYFINLACFTKATARTITLTRSTRDDVLHFNILGGSDTLANNGIFVSKVEKNCKAYEAGLRRGDQILNVNGQCFSYLTHKRALDILCGTTHLSLTVKNNLMGLNETLNPEKSPGRKKRHDFHYYEQEIQHKLLGQSPMRSLSLNSSIPNSPSSFTNPSDGFFPDDPNNTSRTPLSSITPIRNTLSATYSDKPKPRPLTKRMGFKRAVMQKLKINKNNSELDTAGLDNGLDASVLSLSNNKSFSRSSSNPDLSPSSIGGKTMSASTNLPFQEEDNSPFVVKVYRSDQSFKYFPVHKSTTAKELVMLAITEFGIVDQSRYIFPFLQ